ncbi:MAG: hypothetical protein GWN62_17855, partial [Aliifodinibius sp.]|nr:hypothetical protein [Fodinibius sp.]NIW79783.1 hypothetical protein [Calditrichia bacterium]
MSTILSDRDAQLLEKVIAQYGHIASFSDLKKVFREYRDLELRQKIARLVKRGWLVRIKRGL